MWALMMVTLILGNVYSATKLEEYHTHEECESERVRITAELDKVYAGMPNSDGSSYRLECRPARMKPKEQA